GKSHLFGLLRLQVAARGVAVFEADSPREASRPFGLFSQVLEALVDHCSHSGVPQAKLAQLTQALAPVTSGAASAADTVSDGRLAIYDAASELFALAGRATPVFLFPDLDAADKASLEMLRYL